MKRSRWLILLLVVALAGVAIATVVMADPIEDLLNPEPTATAVAAQATATPTGTVTVYIVSGTEPCEFTANTTSDGWRLEYRGTVTNRATGEKFDASLASTQYPIGGSIDLANGATKFKIESTGRWQYAVMPPAGMLTQTYNRNQVEIPDSTFKRTYCGG